MFGIGMGELLVILGIVVLLFGTKRLKTLGADLGSAIKGFRSAVKEEEARARTPRTRDRRRNQNGTAHRLTRANRTRMFDISFPELVVVAVIALLVLGPDRLPGALRTLGLWVGRMSRTFSDAEDRDRTRNRHGRDSAAAPQRSGDGRTEAART